MGGIVREPKRLGGGLVPTSENGATERRRAAMTRGVDTATRYRALAARDRRFDGLFFVGVTTTGVYCRPICPARTPRVERCRFFVRAAEAERAGFRACFRCRPEVAPGSAEVDRISRLVATALDRIQRGALNGASVESLAAALGVTSRHLRRAMEAELGVTPVELAQTRRLALAKQLLQDTSLPITEVAFAAGFESLRRFQALFRARFGASPSALRRGPALREPALRLRLDYRPPYAWDEMLAFLEARAMPGVEHVAGGTYYRAVRLGDVEGTVAVRPHPRAPHLVCDVSASLAARLTEVSARLRALFDLDAEPERIAAHLRGDVRLRAGVERAPGLRVAGAFDAFELGVRAVLGQQVTVRAATTVGGRFVEAFGRKLRERSRNVSRTFPTPAEVAALGEGDIARLGMPGARARTILALAEALLAEPELLLPGGDPARVIAALVKLPGVGPWTAHYIAMRALRFPNAFPAADLGVHRALGVTSARAAELASKRWEPWRAYAVMHLWQQG